MTELTRPLPGGGTYGRSALAEVRNPVLRLPAARAIMEEVPRDTRQLLGTLLRELATEARAEGEHCWRRGKAMMGAYWRVVAVYAKHIAHAIDRRDKQ